MAVVEPIKSPVAEAIERHYRETQWIGGDWNMSASKVGGECERAIWYAFRWASPMERHEGQKVRLFDTGNREEARMIDDLRKIGCEVSDRDPATGKQWTAMVGPIRVKIDGKALGVPGAEKAEHLVECKTHNDKSFKEWKKKGVEAAKPDHYAQCQLGMHAFGLTRALYMAHNKNTDEVDTERVHYDPVFAQQLLAKAERIAHSDRAPPKVETFACKWCRHEKQCRYDEFARVNCRTCLHAGYTAEKGWGCTLIDIGLSIEEQKAGCQNHLYLPDLVPGEQIDATETSVTYKVRVHSGDETEIYIDGEHEKPQVPEVEG